MKNTLFWTGTKQNFMWSGISKFARVHLSSSLCFCPCVKGFFTRKPQSRGFCAYTKRLRRSAYFGVFLIVEARKMQKRSIFSRLAHFVRYVLGFIRIGITGHRQIANTDQTDDKFLLSHSMGCIFCPKQTEHSIWLFFNVEPNRDVTPQQFGSSVSC